MIRKKDDIMKISSTSQDVRAAMYYNTVTEHPRVGAQNF